MQVFFLSALISLTMCSQDGGDPIGSKPPQNETEKNPADNETQTSPFEYESFVLKATDIDPVMTQGLKDHYAYLPKISFYRKNKLFIFIPGTFAKPSTYTLITKTAAEHGYHSLVIHYDNTQTIGARCSSPNDETCEKNILKEFFTGTDEGSDIEVNSTNSHIGRIKNMLSRLIAINPGGKWNQFLNSSSEILWNKISVAGHSQGSYHALFISKEVSLHRACLLSGPGSLRMPNLSFPSWVVAAGATASIKLYGFTNKNDGISSFSSINDGWDNIVVPGTEINIDTHSDYSSSNQFFTEIIPPDTAGSANPAHGSTAVDIVTPIDSQSGRPKFEKLWQYMCFP